MEKPFEPLNDVFTYTDFGKVRDVSVLACRISVVHPPDEMSADEILRVVLTFDQALIDLYRELAGETAVPRVQELFGKLLKLEERKDRQFSVSVLGLSDA